MSIRIATSSLVLLLGLTIVLVTGPAQGELDNVSISSRGAVQEHSPIHIDGDQDFTVENGVVSGSGTENDPYIIEGWDINGILEHYIDGTTEHFCIHIKNTMKHFIIRDCVIHDADDTQYHALYQGTYVWQGNYMRGITLENTKNGTVVNNDFYGNFNADIMLEGSSNISIIKNRIASRTGGYHICLRNSSSNLVQDNKLEGYPDYMESIEQNRSNFEPKQDGIFIYLLSNHNRIIGNTISNMSVSGITINANNNSFNLIEKNIVTFSRTGIVLSGGGTVAKDNHCHRNSFEGIEVQEIRNGLVSGNDCSDNLKSGMTFHDNFENCLIFNNKCDNNGKDGIQFWNGGTDLLFNYIRNNEGYGIWSRYDLPYEYRDNYFDGNGLFDISIAEDEYNIIPKKNHSLSMHLKPLAGTIHSENIWLGESCLYYYPSYELGDNPGRIDMNFHTDASWMKSSGIALWGTPENKDEGQYFINASVMLDEHGLGSWTFDLWVLSGDNERPDQNGSNNDTEGSDPGNGTEPGNEVIEELSEAKNQPPSSGTITPSNDVLTEGVPFFLSASSFDPDVTNGDVVSYEWYIDGIGFVGVGEVLNLSLDKGTYIVRLRVVDSFNKSIEVSMVLVIEGMTRGGERMPLPSILIAVGIAMILCIASIFIYKRERKRKEEASPHVDDLIDVPTPRMTPHTFEGGSVTQVWPERLSPDGLPRNGPMDVQFDTLRERIVYSEIETAPFEGVKLPRDSRRTEMKKALEARRDTYDGEIYSALRSILHEE